MQKQNSNPTILQDSFAIVSTSQSSQCSVDEVKPLESHSLSDFSASAQMNSVSSSKMHETLSFHASTSRFASISNQTLTPKEEYRKLKKHFYNLIAVNLLMLTNNFKKFPLTKWPKD